MKNFLLFCLIAAVAVYVASANPNGIQRNNAELKQMAAILQKKVDDTREQAITIFVDKCINQTNELAESHRNKISQIKSCWALQPSTEDMLRALNTLGEENSFRALIPLMCSSNEAINKCIDEKIDYFYDCMDGDEKAIFNRTFIVFRALADHICAQKIEDLDSFVTVKNDACLLSNQRKRDVQNCFNVNLGRYFIEDDITKVLQIFDDKCESLVSFKSCFGSTYNHCENKKPLKIIEGWIQVIIDTTPCKKSSDVTLDVDNNL